MLDAKIFTILLFFIPFCSFAHPSLQKIKSWSARIKFINFKDSERRKTHEAIRLIKEVLTSDEFRERILSYSFNGSKRFIDHQGLSNLEVYQKIIHGSEILSKGGKNYQMDLELELYHQSSQTIGYTYPDSPRVWINRKYFDQFTSAQIANNLTHEWMHKLGFTHSYEWNQHRDHSIPYAIGRLVEEMILKKSYRPD